jgi:4-hydroxybenzoate polyprenyltransferase
LAWGRLLRLSLAPSAAADVAAGIVLARGTWPAGFGPLALVGGSLCVYHGGMALNDWADRAQDARQARGRPLASGLVAPRAGLLVALVLLCAGPVWASLAAPRCGLTLAIIALLATLYDLRGRGPWLGPLLLASCRALNLGAGVLYGLERGGPPAPIAWTSLALYAAYVGSLSRLARLEDASEVERRAGHPRLSLALASLALLVLGAQRALLDPPATELRAWFQPGLAIVLTVAASFGLLRRLALTTLGPREIGVTVGMALRRLLIATAAMAFQAEGPHGLSVGAAILCGYPMSYFLRRVFPPT